MGAINITHNAGVVPPGLLSQQLYIIIIEYTANMGTLLSIFGIVFNIIIIRTFVVMGLTDGVMLSFLALAVFDLSYLLAAFSLGVTVILYAAELTSNLWMPVEPFGLSIFFTNIMILINITNVLTTTFIAVARSLCVARPLQFKNMFTRKRALLTVLGFATFAVAIYMPLMTNMALVDKTDPRTNKTRPSWWNTPVRQSMKEIIWVVTEMILPVSAQIIITVCVVIMSSSLSKSSIFRQSATTSSTNKNFNTTDLNQADTQNESSKVKTDQDFNKLAKARVNKEVRVVQQVVLISVVYVICSLPKLLISLSSLAEPEFNVRKRYTNIYITVNGIRAHFEMVNSTANIFIYFKYNTKFRITLSKWVDSFLSCYRCCSQ